MLLILLLFRNLLIQNGSRRSEKILNSLQTFGSKECPILQLKLIYWSSPPETPRDLAHYYQLYTIHEDKVNQPINVPSSKNIFFLRNLVPGIDYAILVAPCTKYTNECSNNTDELGKGIVPNFVPTVSVKKMTADSITIEWSAPPPELGNRVHQYKAVASHIDVVKEDWVAFSNSHAFHNLTSGSSYKIRVAACGKKKFTHSIDTVDVASNSAPGECHQSAGSQHTSVATDDPISDTDDVESAQGANYQGDFLPEDSRPISTRDLLCWAWQVSRGMKFLGTKRVLHGDLAARNTLIADGNVIKVCDFGLAKSLLTEDTYKKKGHGPLSIKWMAIESIRDKVFSINSDIWSFGVVLWEFFTLGETPYPGISNDSVYQMLDDGFRMAQPKYASKDIHNIMLRCWDAEPSKRPSFGKLETMLDDLLEDEVKTDYLDFDAVYERINAEVLANGEKDYLTMAPSELASELASGMAESVV